MAKTCAPGFERQRDGDRAGAGADIQHDVAGSDARQAGFHQVLGLRAGNQDIRRDAEIAAVEFLAAGDVLRRLALQALVQIAAVVDPGDFASALLRDARRDRRVRGWSAWASSTSAVRRGAAMASSSRSLVPWRRAVWMVIDSVTGANAAR